MNCWEGIKRCQKVLWFEIGGFLHGCSFVYKQASDRRAKPRAFERQPRFALLVLRQSFVPCKLLASLSLPCLALLCRPSWLRACSLRELSCGMLGASQPAPQLANSPGKARAAAQSAAGAARRGIGPSAFPTRRADPGGGWVGEGCKIQLCAIKWATYPWLNAFGLRGRWGTLQTCARSHQG